METILLVEDSEDDVFFFERAMKSVGLKRSLKIAADGQAAVDYIEGAGEYADRTQYPLPALVLLDLKLPHVLGLDVLKRIRSLPATRMLPVVILTSSGERSDLERAYQMGANAFMVKPSDADDLVGLVKCLGDFWFRYSLLPPAPAVSPRPVR